MPRSCNRRSAPPGCEPFAPTTGPRVHRRPRAAPPRDELQSNKRQPSAISFESVIVPIGERVSSSSGCLCSEGPLGNMIMIPSVRDIDRSRFMIKTAKGCDFQLSHTAKGAFVIMRSDIAPGALFPDYELTDHAAKRRKLSELQGQNPMVLVLSRGGFCPKDRRQAELLVQLHRELEVGYCRLVTISTA